MQAKPILVEDAYRDNVYYRVEPEFFRAPISPCAKGIYLMLTSLGWDKKHQMSELKSMCRETDETLMSCLDELEGAGFDTSNLIRA